MIRQGVISLAALALLLAGATASAQNAPPKLPETWSVHEQVGREPLVKPQVRPDPVRSAGLNRSGLDLARQGDLDRAAGTLLKAVLYNQRNAEAWNSLGVVLRRMGQIRPAIKAYTRAIELQPRYAVAFRNLGSALEDDKQPGLAARAYREYCRLAPAAPDAAALGGRAAWLEGRSAGR